MQSANNDPTVNNHPTLESEMPIIIADIQRRHIDGFREIFTWLLDRNPSPDTVGILSAISETVASIVRDHQEDTMNHCRAKIAAYQERRAPGEPHASTDVIKFWLQYESSIVGVLGLYLAQTRSRITRRSAGMGSNTIRLFKPGEEQAVFEEHPPDFGVLPGRDALVQRALEEGIFDLIHTPYDSAKHPSDSTSENVANFIRARDLLLPIDQVHAHFAKCVLSNPHFFEKLERFFGPITKHFLTRVDQDPATGMAISKAAVEDMESGEPETVHAMQQKSAHRPESDFPYTPEDMALLLVFLKDNPEAVVMMTGYIAGVQQYLGSVYMSMLRQGKATANEQNLRDLQDFIEQWADIPIIVEPFMVRLAACHYATREQQPPDTSPKNPIGADVFAQAVQGLAQSRRRILREEDSVLLAGLYEKVLSEKEIEGSPVQKMTKKAERLIKDRYDRLMGREPTATQEEDQ